MNTSTRQQFEKIAQNVIAEACAVKCSKSDYVEGLEEIIGQLESYHEAAKQELADEGKADAH